MSKGTQKEMLSLLISSLNQLISVFDFWMTRLSDTINQARFAFSRCVLYFLACCSCLK